MNYLIYILLLLTCILLGYYNYLLRKKIRKSDSKETKPIQVSKENEEKLKEIETTLNPHLFKNVLNSIQSHAFQTYYAIDKLSRVLDYILYERSKKWVTPLEEIDFIQDFIEINKIKLSPLFNIQVKLKIDEESPLLRKQILAPLISIDLIENAFKHIDLQNNDASINIFISFKEGIFQLIVSNTTSELSKIEKSNSGIGLKNLAKRLEILYPGFHSFEHLKENDIYTAHLKINLLEYKNNMLTS